MTPYIEISRSDGSTIRKNFLGDCAFIGREDTLDLAHEHEILLIAPRHDGCWVRWNPESQNEVRLDGSMFHFGHASWDSVFEIGSCRVQIRVRAETEETSLESLKSECEAARNVLAACEQEIRQLSDENEALRKRLLSRDLSYASSWYQESLRLVSVIARMTGNDE